MALKNIAIEGCRFGFGPTLAALQDVTALVTLSSSPSSRVFVGGKGVWASPIKFSISGYNGNGITNGDGMTAGVITSTARVTAEGKPVCREGDYAEVVITGTTGSNPPVTVSVKGVVAITDAGQSRAKGA